VKHIVSDLKTFSRSEDEKIAVVQLKHIAETAIQMTWNEIRHRAQLVREFDAAPPVEASAAHLSQVVINLLVNAAQALPEDSSDRMRVTLSIGTTDEGWAYLSVSDTGSGIPPEHLQRIFEPFYTTKPVGEGTGLGLSICHNLVQRYDGEITVQSSIEGTSFRVLLPPSTRALPTTETPSSAGHAPIPSSGRVLVVDDEPEIAQLLKEMLFDFDVSIAENGQEAIDRWTSEDFDVMVCDLMMPKVSGMDVYQAIQRAAPGDEKQILFITGGAFTPATRSFLETLGGPCLQKPFSPHELRQMVIEMGMAQSSEPAVDS
jgi:CheY-like chemotaxis protein/two-component sensor histidine kinase